MKTPQFSPQAIFSFLLCPVLFLFDKKKRKYAVFFSLLTGMLGTGCFKNFYQPKRQQVINDSTISAFQKSEKYFIVHLKKGEYELNNLSVPNGNRLVADVSPLQPEHKLYLKEGNQTYKNQNEKYVLNEVHIYAQNEMLTDSNHLSIPLSSVSRMEIYEKDKSTTTTVHVFSAIGIGVLVAAAILLIAFIISCNCPQVYAYDGQEYQFKSGVFSGAIYSSIERTDYLPLDNIRESEGRFKFKLMNNQQEEQFINHLKLLKVTHPEESQVLIDRHGKLVTYLKPKAPVITSLQSDSSGLIFQSRDGNAYGFNGKNGKNSSLSSVELTFDMPVGVSSGKLLVNAKNSLWSGFIFEEFLSLFGDKYQQYQAKLDHEDKDEIERWQKEQALPLMVYVETPKGWKLVDYFPPTGNTAGRDMIMEILVPPGAKDKLKVKIESAFMFWDLDYAALDFSENAETVSEMIPTQNSFKDGHTNDATKSLGAIDDDYCKLLPTEAVSVEFLTGQKSQKKQSYFLVSTGYYHSLKQYPGKPDYGTLNRLKKKGSFSEFSEARFTTAQEGLAKGLRSKPDK